MRKSGMVGGGRVTWCGEGSSETMYVPKERSRTRTAAAQTVVDSDGRCSLSSFATSIEPSNRARTEGSGHDHGLG